MKEIFKDIQGYEGYQISNLGNVKSLKYGKEKKIKPIKNKYGYLQVALYQQGKRKIYKVHRLVSEAFIPNPNNYLIINHKNEIKTDNRVENLEYCTAKYNINYGTHNQRSAANRINHQKISKQVLCVETGKIYPSTMEVQRQLGFSQSNISSACTGRYKQAYGFHWKYVE